MTKAEIVQALYDRVGGFSKKEAADAVDLVFDLVKETLGRAEKVKISGFGKFTLRDKRQRTGRNPQTGEPMPIRERRVLTFRVSEILKRTLNPESTPGSAGAEEAGSSDAGAANPLSSTVSSTVASTIASTESRREPASTTLRDAAGPTVDSGPQRSA